MKIQNKKVHKRVKNENDKKKEVKSQSKEGKEENYHKHDYGRKRCVPVDQKI